MTMVQLIQREVRRELLLQLLPKRHPRRMQKERVDLQQKRKKLKLPD